MDWVSSGHGVFKGSQAAYTISEVPADLPLERMKTGFVHCVLVKDGLWLLNTLTMDQMHFGRLMHGDRIPGREGRLQSDEASAKSSGKPDARLLSCDLSLSVDGKTVYTLVSRATTKHSSVVRDSATQRNGRSPVKPRAASFPPSPLHTTTPYQDIQLPSFDQDFVFVQSRVVVKRQHNKPFYRRFVEGVKPKGTTPSGERPTSNSE